MNRVKYEGQLNGPCVADWLKSIEVEAEAIRNKFNIPYRTLIYIAVGAKGQSRILHVSRGRNCLFWNASKKNEKKRFREYGERLANEIEIREGSGEKSDV